jgi:hypothetical protein
VGRYSMGLSLRRAAEVARAIAVAVLRSVSVRLITQGSVPSRAVSSALRRPQ